MTDMSIEPVQLSQLLSEEIVVTKQPIFDRELAVFAYELMINGSLASQQQTHTNNELSLNSITEALFITEAVIAPEKKLFLRIPDLLISNGTAHDLDVRKVVLHVLASSTADEQLVKNINTLSDHNHKIAVQIDRLHPNLSHVIEQADFAVVSLASFSGIQVAKIVKILKRYNCKLIATDIDTWEMYSGSKSIGFDYFQGCFFSTADIVPRSKVKTLPAIKMRILKELTNIDDDIDMSSVSQIISFDPSLCINLLKFINSAAFCLPNKVDSIARAVSFLGLAQLKQWAMVSLLVDTDPSEKGREVMQSSLHRAYFLSLLYDAGFIVHGSRDSMFMMGLLSLIDAMFNVDINEFINDLPIETYMQDALLQKEGNPLSGIVRLLKCIEMNDWKTGGDILDSYAIPRFTAAKLYMAASQMAGEALK